MLLGLIGKKVKACFREKQSCCSRGLAVCRLRALDMPGLVVACMVFLFLPSLARVRAGPEVTLAKSASPQTILAGGLVTYTITLTNWGDQALEDIVLRDTLPLGFSYHAASSQVDVNGITITTTPSVSGRTLTWSALRLPAARSSSVYGIHTFVQRRTDLAYIEYQLDRARELMGPGAFVTQLFDWIEPSWTGPQAWMRDLVTEAYERDLTPVIRLASGRGETWYKPKPDADGSYTTWALAFRRVIEGLPRWDGHRLLVQIWNEPNLHEEWEGQANAVEYGKFLVQTAAAIRAIGDSRILILNAPLSPGAVGTIGIDYLEYLDDLLAVPGVIDSFDVWATHPYPNNHPPEYNNHSGTARYAFAAIDGYTQELAILAAHGRDGVSVLLTETGYALYQADFVFEGFPAINEVNRAEYISRAFADYWSQWPEVMGVCPYELVDPEGHWWVWDWLWSDGRSHQQYDALMAMDKTTPSVSSVLRISFQAVASSSAGTYPNSVSMTASNAAGQVLSDAAPVTVVLPTPTRTATPSITPTSTPTIVPTASLTAEPSLTTTTSPTSSQNPSATPTTIAVPSDTAAPSATTTPTQPPTPTASPTLSLIPTASATSSVAPSATTAATATPTVTTTPRPTATCTDLIVNGGFEEALGWVFPETPAPGAYTETLAHSGLQSTYLGVESGANMRSHSAAWQAITIPAESSDPILSFWYYPQSKDTDGDYQYTLIMDTGGVILDWSLLTRSNSQTWTRHQYSLSSYKGSTIRIYFGVYNDGANGITAMYVDDVSVVTCSTPIVTLTPTGTPTATKTAEPTLTPVASRTPSPTLVWQMPTPTVTLSATATPTLAPTPSPTTRPTVGCDDLIVNGGFEEDGGWYIPATVHSAGYSELEWHSGRRSMRLGIDEGNDVYSYSTARQAVYVPAGATAPVLAFWYYPVSADTIHDQQYVRVEDELGSSDWVFRLRSNAQQWLRWEYALPEDFRGHVVTILAGVFNNGDGSGTTAMYLDDVSLTTCGPEATPTPTSRPSSAPVAYLPIVLRQIGMASSNLSSLSTGDAASNDKTVSLSAWQLASSPGEVEAPSAITLDPLHTVLYVGAGNSVCAVDASNGDVLARVPLSATVRALAYDAVGNRVYATLWEQDGLAIINSVELRLLNIIEGIPGPSGVAVDDERIYVAATRSDELVFVDKQTGTILKRVPVGDAPYAVVSDPGRGRVYVGNAGAGGIAIVDVRTATVVRSLHLGNTAYPHGLAFDPVRDCLYVTYALSPKYRALATVDVSLEQVVSAVYGDEQNPLSALYGVAVDPLRGWVYASSADGLLVFAGRSLHPLGVLTTVAPSYAFGLSLSPLADRVYSVDTQSSRVVVVEQRGEEFHGYN